MGNDLSKKAAQAAAIVTGKRFCSHCQQQRPAETGKWLVSANGLNRRWKCGACVERAKERASGGAK